MPLALLGAILCAIGLVFVLLCRRLGGAWRSLYGMDRSTLLPPAAVPTVAAGFSVVFGLILIGLGVWLVLTGLSVVD